MYKKIAVVKEVPNFFKMPLYTNTTGQKKMTCRNIKVLTIWSTLSYPTITSPRDSSRLLVSSRWKKIDVLLQKFSRHVSATIMQLGLLICNLCTTYKLIGCSMLICQDENEPEDESYGSFWIKPVTNEPGHQYYDTLKDRFVRHA